MAHTFDFEHTYDVDKPEYKRTASYDKWYMFNVVSRNGKDIVFENIDKKDHEKYQGRVLVNPRTGDEISFIFFKDMKLKLDARDCHGKGRPLSQSSKVSMRVIAEWDEDKEEWKGLSDCSMTLEEFLEIKAKLAKKKK